MNDKIMTPLDYFKFTYSELLPTFVGEVIDAGGDFAALSAAAAHLTGNALELKNISHSIAVYFTDNIGNNNKLNFNYFSSNVASEDEYKTVIDLTIKHLTKNPEISPVKYEYSKMKGKKTYMSDAPLYVLVLPISTSSATCGYTVVYYHEEVDAITPDSPQVIFLSKIIYPVALAVQCELNEATLEHYLMSDNLTELPNRDHIYEAIIYMLQTAQAFGHRFALMIIRVNGLKHINNSLGIITGDLMLKAMGAIIEKAVTKSTSIETMVGRLSGGDFIVLLTLPYTNSGSNKDMEVINKCCGTIIKETEKHVEINGYKLYPSANIGASIYPSHGETAEELLRKADLAKNDAKLTGPGTFSIYESFMDGDAEEILFLNSNLPTAIAFNQFEMFYQPIVDVKTGKITAMEALIRWNHPERGLISPDSFIQFAEKNAYGVQIDKIVLNMACKQIIEWQNKGIELVVGVNISPKHFANGLIYDTVKKVLKGYKLDPSRLRIELLENILLEDFNSAVKVINDLRSLGVGIALDDFGSGYSSLEYVSKLPLDYLKIDRTFMMNMQKNPGNKVIMETILTLAKGMGVKTVTEGVECKEDFGFLRDIDCEFAQGYFISKPMDVEKVEGFMNNWKLI